MIGRVQAGAPIRASWANLLVDAVNKVINFDPSYFSIRRTSGGTTVTLNSSAVLVPTDIYYVAGKLNTVDLSAGRYIRCKRLERTATPTNSAPPDPWPQGEAWFDSKKHFSPVHCFDHG